MTISSAIDEQLAKYRKKLTAREGQPGYEKNCEMLKTQIAKLEEIAAHHAEITASRESSKDQVD